MENRSTLLEDLPNELFVQIFSYLKDIDVAFAFSQLNDRFQCLLFEFCQYFDFKSVSKRQFDFILQQFNVLQMKSLQFSNDDHTPGQIQYFFQSYSLTKFSSQLQSLSLLKLKIKNNYNILLDQLQLLVNLKSLTIESICGEMMSNIYLPTLKQLVITSCRNSKYLMLQNFSQLENIEYTISDCHLCEPFLTWPLTLKRLKIIFEKTEDLELIQTSLISLSQLITLEIYQKERGWLRTNGQIWEELIRSSLPLLKHFKFFFQFTYLSSQDTQQMLASFSTPFYVHEKNWIVRLDMYKTYYSPVNIYTIPFTFDRLTIIFNSSNKDISTYFNNNNETSCNTTYVNVKTLVYEEQCLVPDESLNNIRVINLIINNHFNPTNWIHILNKLRYLELESFTMTSEHFLHLLINTPHLHSLTTTKCILRKLTKNWSDVSICKHLSDKIQSLKLSATTDRSEFLSRNELKQLIPIFTSNCQYLSLPIELPSSSIGLILRNICQIRSLHVHTSGRDNPSMNMIWLEKQRTKFNNSNCIMINDGNNHYFWLG